MACQSRWPRGLRRRSAATRLLGLWFRIPPEAWMSVSCECCVLSGRGLCDGLITRPEESYRLWCVVECDLETSRMRRSWPTGGCCARRRRRRRRSVNSIMLLISLESSRPRSNVCLQYSAVRACTLCLRIPENGASAP